MENLITLMFDIVLFMVYGTIIFTGSIIVQLISYRVFNFNLYKFIKYILVDKEMI